MAVWEYSVGDLFTRGSRMFPRETAVVCGTVRQTFGELDVRTSQVARALERLSVGKGDRVAVLAHNCHRYLELYGGIAKLGAVAVPLNWRLAPAELSLILQDAEANVLIVGEGLLVVVEEIVSPRRVVERVLMLGRAEGRYGGLAEMLAEVPASPAAEAVASDDPFALVYTAAVEGTPRGAMLTHRNLLAGNLEVMWGLGLTAHDVHLNALPLFHLTDLGLALAVLHAGGRNVILSRFDAATALDMIEREGVTIFGEFAPMLGRLLEEQQRAPRNLGSLQHITGLDRPEVIREAQERIGATFWVAFGQTETAGFVTLAPFSERPGSAGREGPLGAVRIMDESGKECGPREVGEIVVRGPMVFGGYWKLPEATKYTHRGGWHHTGDLAYFDEDGYLWYVERKAEKELIKPGGENVYPVEVERVIAEHPNVKEVAVIGVADPEWGEAVKAVCVLKEGAQTATEEIIQFVKARIASFKKPKHVQFVTGLPRTPEGRIDRGRVQALYGGSRS